MTYRERMERKIERREEWAQKAEARSAASFARVNAIADQIPLGQPILVGHHSEAHARRDQERIYNGMRQGIDEHKLAAHHESKADGLARQLDHSIYSDDPDAIAALEARIAEREAEAAKMVAMNKAWRSSKGDVTKFATLAGISETTAAIIARNIETAYSWEKQPHPAYELQNLRGTIRRDKERIEEIKSRQERSAKAEAAGGVTIEGGEYVSVTFAEKPERDVLTALKAAGFYWQGGSWHGKRASLPEGIA